MVTGLELLLPSFVLPYRSSALRHLNCPSSICSCPRFLIILSLTFWKIWDSYWQLSVSSSPSALSNVEKLVISIIANVKTIICPFPLLEFTTD
ncbi:uncharacterized protein BX663DRAFT_502595 [Cokeromyces recurvatus]|uniref:uncharacterized protein n=1 Tax=Cokeromyces recurvatus TaxID=90255 RepID=UPI00221EB79A|nr:uncharacterized protein BX663DRAFT_502595 [Cokeromyces recurvatus]KAI7904496.1 hypothetical protein BX663DRAFT_502595 [Cokeromyces recurvatus]